MGRNTDDFRKAERITDEATLIALLPPFALTITGTLLFFAATLAFHPANAAETIVETIVMVRHAEKPDGGVGQINCQGLDRALALPNILLSKFERPDAIFAPDPGVQKNDQGLKYNYIRPLATIEPTAIRFGLAVNTQWGFEDIEPLKRALLSTNFHASTVYVAWEHRLLEKAARDILKELGG